MNNKLIRLIARVAFGLFCIAMVSSVALAQESRGTIAGKITDPNGSIVPNATVSVKNVETNIETTATTNDEGGYVVPLLNPGRYSVSVSSSGFKRSLQEVTVSVGDRLSVDFQLEIGTATQEVTVVADMDVLEKGSVTTGTTISSRQIQELPLSEGAAYNLALQAPGVVYTGNPAFTGPTSNSNLAAFRSNGMNGSQITLDGAPNTGWDGSAAYTPPADAVSQFKIQTSSFDAQNGFTAGSTVNVAIKNGTNNFHGSAYYFDRSKPFSANNFFNVRQGNPKPDRHYYRYGGQVNGPIFKDKTFFMAAYEYQFNRIPQPTIYSVPTAKMRTGDFSELLPLGIIIYDPATAFKGTSACVPSSSGTTICRTPFLNNVIPSGRINQGALNFLKMYPLPNVAGSPLTNNYFSNTTNILPYRTVLFRIDHNISSNQKIYGKFFWSTQTDDKNNFLETDDAYTRGFEYRRNKGGNVGYTNTISSNLIFDLRGNYNQFDQVRVPTNPISASSIGLTGIAAITQSTVLPRFNFTNYTTFGPLRSDYSEGFNRIFHEFSLQPTLTQLYRNHTFRYGVDYRHLYEDKSTVGLRAGNFTTTGTYTAQASTGALITTNSTINGPGAIGRDIASFLLGNITSGTLDQGVTYNVYSDYIGGFIQDDWRVTSKLTLNLGLRYEVEGGVRARAGNIVTGFDPSVPNPLGPAALANYNANVPSGIPSTAYANLKGGLVFAQNARDPQQTTDRNNFQPRVGASYALNDRTVIRGGVGIFTAPFQLAGISAPLVQTGYTPTTNFTASNDNGLTFVGTLNNPFPGGLQPATGSSLGLTTSVGSTLGSFNSATGATASVLPHDRKNANALRAIIGIQRDIGWGVVAEATGVYNHGYDLAVFRQLNYVPTANLNNLAGVTDYNTITTAIAAVNTFLTSTVPNPFRGLVPTNSTWNNSTITRYRAITAFPEFQDLVTTDYNGSSTYAALQLQATKRYSNGLTFNGSYTYSYDHEKVRRLNPQDPELTDMVSTASRPHRFTFSGIYELPVGKNKWLGSDWNSWVDGFLGGWQVQAIFERQSGEPIVLPNAYYGGDITKLKNMLGQKDSQGRIYGIDIPAFDTSGFFLADSTGKLTVPAFGSSYQTSTTNTLRYIPYTMNNFRNQYFQKLDAGLTKNFRIKEGMKLQVRIEAINLLNWQYFSDLGIAPAVPSATSNTFGYAVTQRNLPRDIQLGARFTF